MNNAIYFAKVKPNAIIPTKREEDAGYDCYTVETETIVIPPCSTKLIDTGIAIACSNDYFPKFFDKGGMGSKGMIVGAGVGDSGYRDSYFIPIINTSKDYWFVMTHQSEDEVKNATHFDIETNKFVVENPSPYSFRYIQTKRLIVKYLNKAFVQFVMLPVPKLETKEISWEELKAIPSERGLGKLGSSGK